MDGLGGVCDIDGASFALGRRGEVWLIDEMRV